MVLDDNKKNLLTHIFTRYRDELYKFAYSRVKNEADAKDILGDVLYIATLKVEQLYDHPNQIGWLYRVLDYCIKKHHSKDIRKKRITDECGNQTVQFSRIYFYSLDILDSEIRYQDNFYNGEAFEDYKELLTDLEMEYVRYRYVQGFRVKEIAELMNKNYSAITSMGNRIKNKLKKMQNMA